LLLVDPVEHGSSDNFIIASDCDGFVTSPGHGAGWSPPAAPTPLTLREGEVLRMIAENNE
jgi:hypothetical protein